MKTPSPRARKQNAAQKKSAGNLKTAARGELSAKIKAAAKKKPPAKIKYKPARPALKNKDPKEFGGAEMLARLPRAPGVYRFCDAAGAPLYVGKAVDLRRRVSSYFRGRQSPRIGLMMRQARQVKITITESEREALLVENNFIKTHKPRYNILFRDDTSYPYLHITAHDFPRLTFYRGAAAGRECYGPFPDSRAVRQSVEVIQRAFRLRTCADSVFAHRARPCLLHQIKRCDAPCVGKISAADYDRAVSRARLFLKGKTESVVAQLRAEMEAAAAARQYEKAAAARDRIRALGAVRGKNFADDERRPDADYVGVFADGGDACVNVESMRGGARIGEVRRFPARGGDAGEADIAAAFLRAHYLQFAPPPLIVLSLPVDAELLRAAPHLQKHLARRPSEELRRRAENARRNARFALAMKRGKAAGDFRRLQALAKMLRLSAPPERVDCFDVSHTGGARAVAAKVRCENGEMTPRHYRIYKMRHIRPGDDVGALRQAVTRAYGRALREGAPIPDLVVMDGGAAQVNAAREELDALGLGDMPLLGIAKGAARKDGAETLLTGDGEALRPPAADPAFLLLRRIRDEAHRFALRGHRKQRDRAASLLEDIPGVGAAKRRALMAHFGGAAQVAAAGKEELMRLPGLGPALAEKIVAALRARRGE